MRKPSFNRPLIRKGRRGRASIYAVAWVDLLGYGGQIGGADLNPLHPAALVAQERLRVFSEIVKRHSVNFFPSLVMNDGAVFYRHLSFRSTANLSDFLFRARKLYTAIKAVDTIGARMVVSIGFRGRGTASKSDDLTEIARRLKKKVELGEKTLEQALAEALSIRSSFNQVFALNSNYAFTKSYLVDQLGSSKGFTGPSLFIEKAILTSQCISKQTDLAVISASIFNRIYDYVDASALNKLKLEVNDTLTIAKYLANSEIVFADLFVRPQPAVDAEISPGID